MPAPKPVASIVIAGIGPNLDPHAASMAAPVGVVSSTLRSLPWVGMPSSSSTTAGAGFGRRPWALRTMPSPVATGLAETVPTSSSSRAEAVPTMSTIVSWPPTSWKCTCEVGRRWSLPSTWARSVKAATARSSHPLGQTRLFQDAQHVREGPHDGVVADLHDRLGGGDPVAQHRLVRDGPSVDGEPVQKVPELGRIRPGVDEAAEGHVAGDP